MPVCQSWLKISLNVNRGCTKIQSHNVLDSLPPWISLPCWLSIVFWSTRVLRLIRHYGYRHVRDVSVHPATPAGNCVPHLREVAEPLTAPTETNSRRRAILSGAEAHDVSFKVLYSSSIA